MTQSAGTAKAPLRKTPVWREHIGLIFSVSLFVVVTLRVLGSADWDPTVALAIVQSGGAANVALASGLSSAPALVSLLFAYLAGRFCLDILTRRVDTWRWAPVIYGLFFVPFLVPAVYLIGAAILIALTFATRWGLERRHNQPGAGVQHPYSAAERRAWLVAVLGGQLLIASMTPWLPSESLTVSDSKPFVGYVVSDDGDTTTILRKEGSPKIERVDADAVNRSYCEEVTFWIWKPLTSMGRSTLEDCP